MSAIDSINNSIPEFTKYLLLDKKINLNNNLFSIVTENSFKNNSNAFIATIIPYYLKNNFNVVFLSCNESLIHYATISKKYGVNIVNNSNFHFIDSFYSPYKKAINEELPLSEQFPYTFNCIKSKNYYNININENLNTTINKSIITIIDKIINALKESKIKTILIVDNISNLPSSNIKELIDSIYVSSVDNNYSVYLGINTSLLYEENNTISNNKYNLENKSINLYNYIDHLSDLEFEFLDNESGFSKDIDGKIRISIKDNLNKSSNWILIYKIKENFIDFMQHLNV